MRRAVAFALMTALLVGARLAPVSFSGAVGVFHPAIASAYVSTDEPDGQSKTREDLERGEAQGKGRGQPSAPPPARQAGARQTERPPRVLPPRCRPFRTEIDLSEGATSRLNVKLLR